MPTYTAPLRDMHFVLNELWNLDDVLAGLDGFDEINSELAEVVLKEAAKINEQLFFPLNRTGDEQGCQFNNGEVKTPEGFKEAYQTLVEGGWPSLATDPEFGGQGFPQMINMLIEEMMCSSNVSFSLYSGLTRGVYDAITAHGTDELKQRYLPSMSEGKWTGVMCLTESHSGTDLGLLRTKAEPLDNGTYKLSGTKIFITGGDHDLTENIIHLVLARLPDAPAGVKGISLFLVPKFHVNDDGSLGERNAVHCGAIEHKMGIKGSSTCVMNYDGATGYLVGEANKGLNAMFTVMNIERISIGMQGLGLAEIAYQNARDYAKERLQGRAPKGPLYPDKAADPIIVHPNIRRSLLTIRAYNEGARALAVWVCKHIDMIDTHPDEAQREHAGAIAQLFTPIVKAFFTDYGFEACNLALQVFGGHGYISEWGMEQFVRDARIAQIYEGTNDVQALDLVRRKLISNKGAYLKLFTDEVKQFIAENNASNAEEFITPLQHALDQLTEISEWIITQSENDPALAASVATDYLRLFSLTALAYMWAKAAVVAMDKKGSDDFYTTKIQTARFYMQCLLPQTESLCQTIKAGSEPMMAMAIESF